MKFVAGRASTRVRVVLRLSNSNTRTMRTSRYSLRWYYIPNVRAIKGTNRVPSYHYHFSMPHKTSPWCVPLFSSRKVSPNRLASKRLLFLQLVELKNGETFNGHLVNCDNFMNITLREVYQTSADGDRFWKVKECYIRGSTVCLKLL